MMNGEKYIYAVTTEGSEAFSISQMPGRCLKVGIRLIYFRKSVKHEEI